MNHYSRRSFVRCSSLLGAAMAWPGFHPSAGAEPQPSAAAPAAALTDHFPSHPLELVREVVGAAHGNLAKVRERVEAQRTLALATWDWGFGDFESALDGASHVGNRPIAEYLIEKGARPTPFTAAMLGHLDAIKALVVAFPGIQRIRGPHGITLMAHARAGGPAASAVVSYLEALGEADPKFPTVPLTDADLAAIAGTYRFGPGVRDRFDVDLERGAPGIIRPGGTRRMLFHLGSYVFFPSGADTARLRFEVVDGRAVSVSLHDPDLITRAARI